MKASSSFVSGPPGLPQAKPVAVPVTAKPASEKFSCKIGSRIPDDTKITSFKFVGFDTLGSLRQAVYAWRRGMEKEHSRDGEFHEVSILTTKMTAAGSIVEIDLETGATIREVV